MRTADFEKQHGFSKSWVSLTQAAHARCNCETAVQNQIAAIRVSMRTADFEKQHGFSKSWVSLSQAFHARSSCETAVLNQIAATNKKGDALAYLLFYWHSGKYENS